MLCSVPTTPSRPQSHSLPGRSPPTPPHPPTTTTTPPHPQECADTLYAEIDYIAEGRNADRFRRNFREQGWVKVPRVYWQYT